MGVRRFIMASTISARFMSLSVLEKKRHLLLSKHLFASKQSLHLYFAPLSVLLLMFRISFLIVDVSTEYHLYHVCNNSF